MYSCKKCGTCEFQQVTTVNQPIQGYPMVTNTTQEACGDDYDKLKGFSHTKSTTNSGGLIITTSITRKACYDK